MPEGIEAESLASYRPPEKFNTLQENIIPTSWQQPQRSQYRNRDYDAVEETSSYTTRQRLREHEEEETGSYSPRQRLPRNQSQSQPRYQNYQVEKAGAHNSPQRSSRNRGYEEDSSNYTPHQHTSRADSNVEANSIERAPRTSKGARAKEPHLHLSDIIPESFSPYAYRWETLAPTPDELVAADRFFLKYPPKHLWSEAKFKKIDFGDVPEVLRSWAAQM